MPGVRRWLAALLLGMQIAACSDRGATSPAAEAPAADQGGPAGALQPREVAAPPAEAALPRSGDGQRLFDEGVAAFQAGDPAGAARSFEGAAALGHAHAQVQLGWQYEYGKGVPQDLGAAVAWYHRAAEQGDRRAQHNIGNLYLKGKGLPFDPELARTWLARSAQQGDAEAMHDLGYIYEFGVGVPKDTARAIAWYAQAGERGNRESAFAAEHLRRGGVAAPSAAAREAFLGQMFRDLLDTSAAYDRAAEARARGRARAAGDSEGNWRSYLTCSGGGC